MTQGERETAVDRDRLLRRHRLRMRTVAVSFRAAVTSAEDHYEGPGAERDALVEVWRAWSLDQLERYRSELEDIARDQPELAEPVAELLGELTEAQDTVRRP